MLLPSFYLINLIEKLAQPFSWVLYILGSLTWEIGEADERVSRFIPVLTLIHTPLHAAQSRAWPEKHPLQHWSDAAALCEHCVSCVRWVNCKKSEINTPNSGFKTPIIYPSGDRCSLVTTWRAVTHRCWFIALLTLVLSPPDSSAYQKRKKNTFLVIGILATKNNLTLKLKNNLRKKSFGKWNIQYFDHSFW